MMSNVIHLANIHSVTDFQKNIRKYVADLKSTRLPIVLTVNGKAELVVQDAESYQVILDRLERAEAVAGIKQGLEEFAAGKGLEVAEAFDTLKDKYGISD